ncbi:MAG: aminotransferase class I/II-fold pyridoxal phosphate-dependent enzyme [Bacteroidales bacterium]|nr:aminotransferase class I/II-fold pyridoxal phosphate-dependent enzyme [Bacteroidales bacterium]MBN2758031.1 aminotransferase class I/II-fold pyridoxal phosphate-dependent enzyme [Bacteroidales bacterium]
MIIDLRSDTVTKPTPEMLDAMFKAKVGDDIYDEDPTVNELQTKIAKLFNKDASLFVPSGTMANQISIKIHTQPGDEVICDKTAHIYNFEGGGLSFNSGISARLINGNFGKIKAEDVLENINPKNIHSANSSIVSLENTSNKGGGSCYDISEIEKINKVCKENNLKLHLDGARLFNAIAVKKYTTIDIGNLFDSVSICLSKGLGTPVGSVIIGNSEFIDKAKRYRKLFGGAMRQAGYLAAAGIYALDNHVERLKKDHENAQEIVNILKRLNYIEEIYPVETNIIIFKLKLDVKDSYFVNKLSEKGIKVSAFGPQLIRMVTHLDFHSKMLNKLEEELKNIA